MSLREFSRILRSETGAVTQFGLFVLMGSIVVGGLGLDVANAYMTRTQLQATADAVAHAALYVRDSDTEANAIAAGLSVARQMMPPEKYGNVITAADIRFGTWDRDARQFVVSPGSDDAVMVDISRSKAGDNPVATFFLRFAGFQSWNVRRGAVYETYRPTCFREGFVAQDVVDIQSNNSFANGFCIHSNSHVEVQNNGSYETGVIVSMPDKHDIVLPSSGFNSNPGLKEALRDGAYQIRILNELPGIINGLWTLDTDYLPPYITGTTVLKVGRNLSESDFTPGYVHSVTCEGGQHVQFNANFTLTDVVLVTDCPISFASGGTLHSSIIATTNTKNNSVSAGSEFTIGLDDDCAEGGGSQVLTLGGADFSAGLNAYGGQIIAMDDIEFSANADGIQGASFISGGTVSGTSNMSMGFCGSGMELNFEADYFRMAS